LFTKAGRVLTARGVKPICKFQQVFKSSYLFGAFSPLDGSSFLLELPFCNSHTFQTYLDNFSNYRPLELKIIVLDNGAFHKAQSLKIPENIILVFLPPYSPELNPAEKIWAKFKKGFTNKFFNTLDEVSEFISQQCKLLKENTVMSICAFKYIFSGSFWTKL
jgi:transposase